MTKVQKKKKKQKSAFQVLGDNFVVLGKLMQRPGAKLGDIANAADSCGMKIDVRLTKPLEPFKPQTGTSRIKRPEEQQSAEFLEKAKSLLDGVAGSPGVTSITVTPEACGLVIQPEGTGVAEMENCGPVYVEFYDGLPRVVVWPHINDGNDVQIVELAGALEACRNPEPVLDLPQAAEQVP